MKRLLSLLFLLAAVLVQSQHQDKVDFTYADAYVEVRPDVKGVRGTIAYKFKIIQDVDSVFLDARDMEFGYTSLNDTVAKYEYRDGKLVFRSKFKKDNTYSLGIGFEAEPKQTVYFIESGTTMAPETEEEAAAPSVVQIWTQGQGKYTSHWLPSFDDMEEKVEFDLTIAAPSGMQVIANGKNIHNSLSKNGAIMEWHYDMQKPMSSYLLAFAIGNYAKQESVSQSGIPIVKYYYPEDSLKVEPTYRYTERIFDFLEKEIGVPYPWQNYKQAPLRDFLYAGMENTGTTLFSDGYMIDSIAFVDTNYVNVNAHELAHQWFGNLVTEKDGNHHWLHEGFATYYAYLAEKELFGTDHFYWRFQETLWQLQERSKDQQGESLLNPKASSLTFYEKGAWALLALREEVGDEAFRKGIQNYLRSFQFANATVDDFLQELKATSTKDLSRFKKLWLEGSDFPVAQAQTLLQAKSASLKLWYALEDALQEAEGDTIDYMSYWNKSASIHFKKQLLYKYHSSLPKAIYDAAYHSDTIPLRQALFSRPDASTYLEREKLETLLTDASYTTKELALFGLWQTYPQVRARYLDATKDMVGLPNKNLRLLWLTLAMLSENYQGRQTKVFFDELSAYTDPGYGFEIRQGAFFYLKEAFGLNDRSLINLVKATDHHAWRFRKFARNLLDELLRDLDYKTRLQALAPKLKPEESRYLTSKLKTE